MIPVSAPEATDAVSKSIGLFVFSVLEAFPVGVITTDSRGRIDFVNSAAARILESAEDGLTGRRIADLLPEIRSLGFCALLDGEQSARLDSLGLIRETRAHRADGRSVPIQLAANRFEMGKTTRCAFMLWDISGHKEAEAALLEGREKIRALLETVPNAIITTDEHGLIESFNLAAEPMFQCTAEDVVGQRLGVLLPSLEPSRPGPSALKVLAEHETTARRKDGSEFPAEIAVGEINFAGERLLACAVKDISDRVRAERQARQAREQLIQAERLASLGSLVAGVAHEINTPVGIGVTAASHLQEALVELSKAYRSGQLRRTDLERFLEESDQATRILETNLRRASELIISFKQVAVDRANSDRRAFRIDKYLAGLMLSLKPQLKGTAIKVRIDCAEDLEVYSDPGALAQILTNLVLNSLTHGYEDGDSGNLAIKVEMANGTVHLYFSDDGRGIPPENLGRIFDPFFTTRRGSGGSGLGLHVVYNLVTRTLGGTVSCSSEPARGTKFEIVFPGTERGSSGK